MMHVVSLGDYYADVTDEDDHHARANLRDRLATVCSKRPRRIDRFIELSLLGSGLCAANMPQGIDVDDQTALYISSGLASMSNVVKVQQQIFVHGQPPKPASFINTLSNSAGYHVARNLSMTGKNIFVSRQNSSFEAILQLAALDFATGACRAALLGVVDECPSPLSSQRKRMRLEEGAPLAEGSHWFFLQPTSQPTSWTVSAKHRNIECISFACSALVFEPNTRRNPIQHMSPGQIPQRTSNANNENVILHV